MLDIYSIASYVMMTIFFLLTMVFFLDRHLYKGCVGSPFLFGSSPIVVGHRLSVTASYCQVLRRAPDDSGYC